MAVLLLASAAFESTGGIVVASILRVLDNIVKEYSASVANIVTAIVSAALFPDKFKITGFVVLSLGCLVSGIFLYERCRVKKHQVVKILQKQQV